MAFTKFFLPAFLACTAQAALQYKGADWSSLLVLERDNVVEYKDINGTVKPLETILVENGLNIVRQRVVCLRFMKRHSLTTRISHADMTRYSG